MGVLWGTWHFPLFSASARASAPVPGPLFMAVLLFSWLLPYRVLMVWVYDHTKSLLLSILMHVPIVIAQFVLFPATSTSAQIVSQNLAFTAALWTLVAVVFAISRGSLKARPNTGKLPV